MERWEKRVGNDGGIKDWMDEWGTWIGGEMDGKDGGNGMERWRGKDG